VLGRKGIVAGGVVQMKDNPFNQGSSGGAWLAEDAVLSVNSHFRGSPNPMYGPLFDAKTRDLYDYVASDCNDDTKLKGSSLLYDEALKKNPSKAVVGFLNQTRIDLVELHSSSSSKCPCKNSQTISLASSDIGMRIVEYETSYKGAVEDDVPSTEIELIKGESTTAIGCSLGNMNGDLCKIENDFRITSSRRVIPNSGKFGLLTLDVVSPEFCRRACDPETEILGYCEGLGQSTKAV